MKNRPLIIISGPTATGKTATSIRLANALRSLNPHIINFDSLLFYRELNIGTAKPTTFERGDIKHSLIDVRSITDPLNAADFTTLALELLEASLKTDELPIIVGGSGFYLRALVKGMYDSVDVSDEIKAKGDALYQAQGIDPFIETLKLHDPQRLSMLHANDHYRIRRAWEHWQMTGKPVSPEGDEFAGGDPYDFSQHRLKDWSLFHIHLDIPRAEHNQIIETRTGQMLQDGFITETQELLNAGFSGEEKPLQSIGYKEILNFLAGHLAENELPERINAATRRLAKQQRTFFAKIKPKNTYHPIIDVAKIEEDVVNWLQART